MKTYEVSEKFIKEAFEAACETWKGKIKKEFPELFEVELEVGRWYKNLKHEGSYMLFNGELDKSRGIYTCLGVTFGGNWKEKGYWGYDEGYRLATKEEIETMLWKEAEKRGIGKDTKVEFHADNNVACNNSDGGYQEGYYAESDRLWNSKGCIYHKGKWSVPLNENKEIQDKIDSLQKQLDELKLKVK